MKKVVFKKEFIVKRNRLRKTNQQLSKKIDKQLRFFLENPNHPSLRNHKLKGSLNNTWSISVNRSFRLFYLEKEETYFFIDLGFHDEIYKN